MEGSRKSQSECTSKIAGAQEPAPEPAPLFDNTALLILLERFRSYFARRASTDDSEILTFSMRYTFLCVSALYQVILPELTACIDEPVAAFSSENAPDYRYRVWTRFQDMRRCLERLGPLCALLGESAAGLLQTLNKKWTTRAVNAIDDAGESRTRVLAWRRQTAHEYREHRERKEQAQINAHLLKWRQEHDKRLSFTIQFADQITLIPAITGMDAACDLLLNYTCAIFGEILPTFQKLPSLSETEIATLLIDLSQKADLSLLQVNALLEPLQLLIRYYGAGASGGLAERAILTHAKKS
ncbi:MAG: hypothetical protein IMW89_19985 [Ktedonobacteraceae bacterium]|nr:hypothetical protein [Ktedonobacteraceae bacterium]